MERNEFNQAGRARREFLRTARTAGLLGVVAVVFGRSAQVQASAARQASVNAAEAGAEERRGYHETEHIRKYYYCARYW